MVFLQKKNIAKWEHLEVAAKKAGLNVGQLKTAFERKTKALFSKYHSLTAKEFSELSGTPRNESENELNELSNNGTLEKLTTKNGSIWKLINGKNINNRSIRKHR